MPHRFANVLATNPQEWRTYLLTAILRTSLLVSIFVYPPSVYMLISTGQGGVALVDTLALAGIGALFAFDRMPFRARAGLLCMICYMLGTALLVSVGPLSQIYLFAFSIVTTLLLGLRPGLCAVAVSSLTILLIGYFGFAAAEMTPPGWPADFIAWTVITLNFALIAAVLTLAIGVVLAGLEGALQREIAAQNERRKLEQALYQSQKMESLGQLAGGVAHDFNNLLTVISGYCDILLATMPPHAPSCDHVGQILRASERAASLTKQLLAFSRQTVLAPKVLDPNLVIADMEKMARRLVGEDIVLTTVLDPHVPRVKVDPTQLGQILMNLAVNARDAMPMGGKLTIETAGVELDETYRHNHPEAAAGRFVRISMSDTGTGMTSEVKSRIFEPFYTTKGLGHGTGLGLAVVHGIVRQSGGHIEVYSEKGVGSTFKVYLPASDEPLSASSRAELGDLSGTATILLVEDETPVRELATMILQTYGHTVLAAGSGAEALRLLDKCNGTLDLLVTDVVMPGMDGREVADAARAAVPNLKVLYLSGYTDDAVVRHGVLQEKMAFLQKPFTSVDLAHKVRQVLDQPIT